MARRLTKRGKRAVSGLLVAVLIAVGAYLLFDSASAPETDNKKKPVISQQDERRLERSLNSSDPNVQVLVIADGGQDHRKKFLADKKPMLPAGTKVNVDRSLLASNKHNRIVRAVISTAKGKKVQYKLHLVPENDTWNILYTEPMR